MIGLRLINKWQASIVVLSGLSRKKVTWFISEVVFVICHTLEVTTMLQFFHRWLIDDCETQRGWIYKLNDKWTPLILMTLSVISLLIGYVGNPVTCWCPNEFQSPMIEYTNNYCWRSDSVYNVHFDDDIPKFRNMQPEMEIMSRIRWIPLILFLQAILFKIHGVLMSVGKCKLGMKKSKVRGLTDGYTKLSLEDRKSVGKQLCMYLEHWLKNRFLTDFPFGEMTIVIGFVHVIYAVNITLHIVVVDKYMKDPKFLSFGTQIIHNLLGISGLWIRSPAFIDIFFCDFKIRKLATVQQYTVQCINNLAWVYEQMFAILWFWFAFTAVVTFCCCVFKGIEIILPFIRTRYVKQYLGSGVMLIHCENDVPRFANNILGEDGIMALKGIVEVSSEYLVRDVIINLWISNFGPRFVKPQETTANVPANIQRPGNIQNLDEPETTSCRQEVAAAVNTPASCEAREESKPLLKLS